MLLHGAQVTWYTKTHVHTRTRTRTHTHTHTHTHTGTQAHGHNSQPWEEVQWWDRGQSARTSARADTCNAQGIWDRGRRDGGTGTGGALHSTVRQQLALVLDSPHTHSSVTSYLFLGARVGPAVEEGTDTDRKVGTQREARQRDRERKCRECAQSYMLRQGISTQNARIPVTLGSGNISGL